MLKEFTKFPSLENSELSGVESEYDKGWYDALVMVQRYFEEGK